MVYKKGPGAQPQLSTTSTVWRNPLAKEVTKIAWNLRVTELAAKTSNLTLVGHMCPVLGPPHVQLKLTPCGASPQLLCLPPDGPIQPTGTDLGILVTVSVEDACKTTYFFLRRSQEKSGKK